VTPDVVKLAVSLAAEMRPGRPTATVALMLAARGLPVPRRTLEQARQWMRAEPERIPAGEGTATKPQRGLRRVRARVLAHLEAQGFEVDGDRIVAPSSNKDDLRRLHAGAVAAGRAQAAPALSRYESQLVEGLAAGDEINPALVSPRLVEVEKNTPEGRLWRWCSLHWSIPVSAGYGRRLRFLVVDAAHGNAVIGLIGLGDPVYSLRARDEFVGWNAEQKKAGLTSVMDAFVLGAVPPYSHLLGGKLVALLGTSTEVRLAFARKYGHRRTLISGRDPHAQLLLVTTTSALGRSSVYNRLRWKDGALAYEPAGFTQGSGDFHLGGDLYEELVEVAKLAGPSTALNAKWRGAEMGFRNRRETIQKAMRLLAIDIDGIRYHGVRREVFMAPLAENTPGMLRGDSTRAQWRSRAAVHVGDWWKERWALPRAEWDRSYKEFDPESWRLWTPRAPMIERLSTL